VYLFIYLFIIHRYTAAIIGNKIEIYTTKKYYFIFVSSKVINQSELSKMLAITAPLFRATLYIMVRNNCASTENVIKPQPNLIKLQQNRFGHFRENTGKLRHKIVTILTELFC